MRPGPRKAPKIISYIIVIAFFLLLYYFAARK